MEFNREISLAEQYVKETGMSVFLTGKAGTGKTTFLHHVVSTCTKRSVVLAPTGVAAVNAGGVTIHSFFQLPFCPYLPEVKELVTEYQMPEKNRQLRKSKLDVIRTLELLIIDEISMVRADLLDAVDEVLRRVRRNGRPFGGVQLLMIGDVQQLAPVVTEEERPYMMRVYPSPFFFHSKALARLQYVTIQLKTIYRQQDPYFVSLLNNVRDNKFDTATLEALNKRVCRTPAKGQDAILLTTHNYQADTVNRSRMEALKGKAYTLEAEVKGSFPETSFPTEPNLVLKKGARVMFVKNDTSGGHNYYNGKLGTVEDIAAGDDKEMVVKVADDEGNAIEVGREVWENVKYEVSPDDKEIHQVVDGTFSQYPLRLAWAVTIHKAQGLTFDRVMVDAAQAFAYGQVYVALSRCRSLEGLTLLSPITAQCGFSSADISQFNGTLTSVEEAEGSLEGFKDQYYYNQLYEVFDFSAIVHEAENLERIYQNNLRTTYPKMASAITMLIGKEVAGLADVAERFHRQLMTIATLPAGEGQPKAVERVGKAAVYFDDCLNDIEAKMAPMLDVEIDSKETASRFKEAQENYLAALELKKMVMQEVRKSGFDIVRYQRLKVDFALRPKQASKVKKESANYGDIAHPGLVPLLTAWRKVHAEEDNVPAFAIIHQKTLLAIADKLPRDSKALLKIVGMGKVKVAKYGLEILQIIDDYCDEQDYIRFE